MDEMRRLPLIGESFPEMEVKTTHGMMKLPEALKDKWFIFFSHPADFTPVCTTEFYSFQKRYDEFRKLNCELVGLSMDQVFAHIMWVDWIRKNLKAEIQFPVVADHGAVAMKLGLIHPAKGTNTVRGVFIVDPKGIIRAMLFYPQELGRNVDELLRMVKGLQVSTQNSVAMPANWPNNELVKDEVIIPPAGDVKTAEERKSQYECYDWWFCHKKL